MLSNHSRGTLMSYTDHSAQRRFKSNTPLVFPFSSVLVNSRCSSLMLNHHLISHLIISLKTFIYFFWLCEPFGRHVLRWSGSVTNHHYFLLLSKTYVLGNVRSELFLVYGCGLFMFLCCFCFLQQTFILLFILPYFKRDFSSRRFGI